VTDPTDAPTAAGAGPGASGDEQVGTLGEEATRLLGALSAWARDTDATPDGAGAAVRDAASAVGDLARDAERHWSSAGDADAAARPGAGHGSVECTWCPLCRTLHAVRATSPEVRAHLTSAATSLLQAATGLLAALATAPATAPAEGAPDRRDGAGEAGRPRGGRPERIDLDDTDDTAGPDDTDIPAGPDEGPR